MRSWLARIFTAASLFVGDKNPHALPDSGKVAADARHPEIILNYSNANGTDNQTRFVKGVGDFTMPVPSARYAKLFLYFTSAEGASSLMFTLNYADSTHETVNVEFPDYYNDIPATDPVLFYVVKDLAKWSKANKMTEATHHNIDGIELKPSQAKALASVKVAKTAKGYLVFWGATSVSEGPVTARVPQTHAYAGEGRNIRIDFAGQIPAGATLDLVRPDGTLIRAALTVAGKEFRVETPVSRLAAYRLSAGETLLGTGKLRLP